MKRMLLLLLLSVPLQAQTAVTFLVTSQTNSGSSSLTVEGQNLQIDFDGGMGGGIALTRNFGHWSGEVAVFRTSSSGSLRMGGASVFRLGDLDLTPVTAMLRYERGHVYLGGGAAYVLAGDLVTDDGRVEIGNEVAPVIGGGLAFGGSGRVGFVIDVRYIPLSISGRPPAGEDRIEADVDPLLASAGMRIRF